MKAPSEARALRVLLVDDSPTIRRFAKTILENKGHAVTAASSGEEAFEMCLRAPFDIAVSDMTMGALSGVQLCRLLRTSHVTASMPFVMLTASNDRRSRFWARNAGADAYIAKDQMEALLPDIVDQLGKPRQLDAAMFSGREAQPLERLSTVLDEILFKAVLASEVHRQIRHVDDRKELARAILMVAGEVVEAAYLVLHTEGSDGAVSTVLIRGVWPAKVDAPTRESMSLGDDEVDPLIESTNAGPLDLGERIALPIHGADASPIAELRAYAAGRNGRLGARDEDTLIHVAREAGLVLQSAVLAEKTRMLARTDALTGLSNRRATVERLEHEIKRIDRIPQHFCVALCDIDKFKLVNDNYGHQMGDDVLKAVAGALKRGVRNIDHVGRWGGEEILVILPTASEMGGRIVAERLRASVEALAAFENGPTRVTTSIGVACWAGETNFEALVDRADRALYRAKSRGRNRVELESAPKK